MNLTDDLKLDPQGKFYVKGKRKYERLTHVLAYYGLGVNPFYTKFGSDKGTNIHLCCAMLGRGELDWDSVDPRCLPKVKGYEKFLNDTGFKPEIIEQCFCDDYLGVACTVDAVGNFQRGQSIIELKSGAQESYNQLQTAMQLIILASNKIQILNRYTLYLKDYSYKLVPNNVFEDIGKARTLLQAHLVAKEFGGMNGNKRN